MLKNDHNIEKSEQNSQLIVKRGSLQLWQFLLKLLNQNDTILIIEWTKVSAAEFKLLDPEEVARRWGQQKNRPTMNYDKLSRSLRYYYEKGIMQKVAGERYVYRFINYSELCQFNPDLKERFENNSPVSTNSQNYCKQKSYKRFAYTKQAPYATTVSTPKLTRINKQNTTQHQLQELDKTQNQAALYQFNSPISSYDTRMYSETRHSPYQQSYTNNYQNYYQQNSDLTYSSSSYTYYNSYDTNQYYTPIININQQTNFIQQGSSPNSYIGNIYNNDISYNNNNNNNNAYLSSSSSSSSSSKSFINGSPYSPLSAENLSSSSISCSSNYNQNLESDILPLTTATANNSYYSY